MDDAEARLVGGRRGNGICPRCDGAVANWADGSGGGGGADAFGWRVGVDGRHRRRYFRRRPLRRQSGLQRELRNMDTWLDTQLISSSSNRG